MHISEEATRGHSQGSLQRPAYLYIQHAAAAATAAAGRAPHFFFSCQQGAGGSDRDMGCSELAH